MPWAGCVGTVFGPRNKTCHAFTTTSKSLERNAEKSIFFTVRVMFYRETWSAASIPIIVLYTYEFPMNLELLRRCAMHGLRGCEDCSRKAVIGLPRPPRAVAKIKAARMRKTKLRLVVDFEACMGFTFTPLCIGFGELASFHV